MLNTDGTSTAFGLTFREHDNRQMQHILCAHSRLPDGPAARPVLYLALTNLETSLPDDEAQKIRDWLRAGGVLSEFPGPSAVQGPPINGSSLYDSPQGAFPTFQFGNLPLGPPGTGHTVQPSHAAPSYETDGDNLVITESVQIDGYEDESQAEDDADSDDEDSHDSGEKEGTDMESDAEDEADSDGNQAARTTSIQATPGYYHNPRKTTKTEVPEDLKECSICVNQYSPDGFPESANITTTCDHDPQIPVCCIRCIRDTIYDALKEGQAFRIHCPMCVELFKQEDVKKYGTPEIISR